MDCFHLLDSFHLTHFTDDSPVFRALGVGVEKNLTTYLQFVDLKGFGELERGDFAQLARLQSPKAATGFDPDDFALERDPFGGGLSRVVRFATRNDKTTKKEKKKERAI